MIRADRSLTAIWNLLSEEPYALKRQQGSRQGGRRAAPPLRRSRAGTDLRFMTHPAILKAAGCRLLAEIKQAQTLFHYLAHCSDHFG
jgi:hypothetical protein